MPQHYATSEHRAPTWHMHMDTDQHPLVLWGVAHTLQLVQSQEEQCNCYKRSMLH